MNTQIWYFSTRDYYSPCKGMSYWYTCYNMEEPEKQRITSPSEKSKTKGAEIRLGFARGWSEIRGLALRGKGELLGSQKYSIP